MSNNRPTSVFVCYSLSMPVIKQVTLSAVSATEKKCKSSSLGYMDTLVVSIQYQKRTKNKLTPKFQCDHPDLPIFSTLFPKVAACPIFVHNCRLFNTPSNINY